MAIYFFSFLGLCHLQFGSLPATECNYGRE